MKNLAFPIHFTFKISTLSNDFTATNDYGETVAYVKQKMFKLKESIIIYSNETKSEIIFTIKADRWLDFSAAYSFYNAKGQEIGKVARKGWASIWKANYEIIDQQETPQYVIREENGMVKVLDGIVGEIPILGFFTGYLFNPAYKVTDFSGRVVARLVKEPSFWGRRFKLIKMAETDEDDDERLMLGLMMMTLLERRRG